MLYRARFLGLYEEEAEYACKSLRKATIPCAILPNPDYKIETARRDS